MAEGIKSPDRYEGLKEDIAEKLKFYEIEYFRWDKPVPFCGLMVYPAMVREYETFSNCSSCFTLNRKTDPHGLVTSNLGYLYYKMQLKENNEGALWSYKFQKLCEIIFHITNGLKCKKCGKILSYDSPEFLGFIAQIQELTKNAENGSDISEPPTLKCPECGEQEFIEMIKVVQDPSNKKWKLYIDGHEITAQDFDLLRQLVLYQNFPDYADDSWVDPAIKADYEAKMELQYKQNPVHASLEQKIVGLSVATAYPLDYIYTMSIRKFTMALGSMEDLINYKIMKTAAMSGFVKLEKGQTIDHWLYKKDKDMFGNAYKDVDQVKSEVNNL